MKIRLSRKLKQMASALLVTMVLGGILCLFVMYYLSLIGQQNTLSIRSQAWNIAIAVCEAGIEEGLQALNSARNPPNAITLSFADGWNYLGGSAYYRSNSMPDGNNYTIRINLSDPNEPQIICRAYVTLPALAANMPSAVFAVAGVPIPTVITRDPRVITRAVKVHCWDSGFLLGALVAKHKIDLKGNGVLTDSFDSGSLWKSYFGQYDSDPTLCPHGDRGDVASNDGVVSTISVQNANIYGHASTGHGGTVTIGGGGGVGSHAWQATHAGSYESGWVLDTANFTFPKTDLPYSSGLDLGVPQTIVTLTYEYGKTITNSTVYPNPAPWSGVTQHYLTTSVTSSSEPAPGTYVGSVTIKYAGGSGNEKTYIYDQIIGTNYTYAVYHTNSIYTTNTYDHVITTGDYYTTDDMHGSIIVMGDARLVLPNGLSMSGNDQITIAPGGSLKMFVDGASCTVGGKGILNQAGYAEDFILQCTDNVKTFTFNGNGEFIGALVAPEADMTMNGGGKSNNDFIGAVMMNSIGMNGHFSFHYDEALSRLKNNPRLLVKSWDEIK
jgi:hypothetical protein